MALDPNTHILDPASGFAVHNQSGALLGVEQIAWPVPKESTDFPKWVTPHESHIARLGDAVSTPLFEHHVARDGAVTVLVVDAEHEAKALAPQMAPTSQPLAPAEAPAQTSHEAKDSHDL